MILESQPFPRSAIGGTAVRVTRSEWRETVKGVASGLGAYRGSDSARQASIGRCIARSGAKGATYAVAELPDVVKRADAAGLIVEQRGVGHRKLAQL